MKLPTRFEFSAVCCLPSVVLCLLSVVCTAQYTVYHINKKQGLSQGTINCITQDSRGFMWFGSEYGLNRYDGTQCTVYKEEENGLHGSVINSVAEVNRQLFTGTNKGLNVWDARTQKFRYLPLGQLPAQTAFIIAEKDNWLYLLGSQNGLLRYHLTTHRIEILFANAPIAGSYFNILQYAFLQGEKIWLTNGHQLLTYHLTNHRTDTAYTIAAGKIISSFCLDTSNHVWLGTNAGLLQWNRASGQTTEHALLKNRSTGVVGSLFFHDGTNTVWAGTEVAGAFYSRTDTIRFAQLQHQANQPQCIAGNLISTIYVGRDSTVWLNTNPEGVDQLTQQHEMFNLIQGHQLPNKLVRCFAEDARGQIWVGTYNGGIAILNPAQHKIVQQLTARQTKGLTSNTIFYLRKDKAGRLLAATDNGLLQWSETAQRFYTIPIETNSPSPETNVVTGIIQLPHTIAALTNAGLFILDTHTQKLQPAPALPHTDYYYLQQLDSTTVVMGRLANGVDLFSIANNSLKFEKEILPGHNVLCMVKQQQTIYCGTDKGIALLQGKKVNWLSATTGYVINSLQTDNAGNIWFSSNSGMGKLNPLHPNDAVKIYTPKDGLQSYEFNQCADYKTANGTLCFGGIDGFNYFLPASIKSNEHLPQIYLHRFEVNNQAASFIENRVSLSYTQNSLNFELATLDLYSKGNNTYRYQLQGIDEDWVNAGNKNYVRYAKLPPGSYVLKAQAANNEGVWSANTLMYEIEIKPPFYQRWWFYLLCTAVFAGLLYAVYRIRLHQQLRTYRLRTDIANDLHDDIGSTLTGISLNTQVAQRKLKNKNTEVEALLEEIRQSSATSIDTMSDIVWSINPGSGQLSDVLSKIELLCERQLYRKDISYRLHYSAETEKIPVNMQARKNIYLTVKEAIHNLIKYSQATEAVIHFEITDAYLCITISDNGIGFDEKQTPQGNGLRTMQQRIAQLNGSLEIVSAPQQGTTIKVIVAVKYLG